MNNQVRTLFYGIIGAYLIYLAYDLWPVREGMEDAGATGMLVCCILFAIAGVVFVLLALRLFKKVFIDKDENFVENDAQEETSTESVEQAVIEENSVSEEKTEEQKEE